MGITAKAYSDDQTVQVQFDASGYFEAAEGDDLVALARCGWGGDRPGDLVAEHYRAGACRKLFLYLATRPAMPYSDDQVGFECYVDEAEAATWLAAYRPELLSKLAA